MLSLNNNMKTLEKIANSIKEAGRKSWKFVKHNTKIGVMIVGLGAGAYSVEEAHASPGYLTVNNCLNSKKRNVNINRNDSFFVGATDGYDNGLDSRANSQNSGYPNFYSDIPGYHLWSDVRPEDSNIPYDLKLSFRGTLTTSKPNWLEFSFPYGPDRDYGNLPITFESSRLPFGPVVDVKRAIAQNGGVVNLIDVPAGTYDQWTPYGSGELDIGSRLLADLNDDGKVDFVDYSIQVTDYGKAQGQYVGDIVGPNGVPGGYVDGIDLGAFTDSWLADVNDPNSW
jgi:hypothetical protein